MELESELHLSAKVLEIDGVPAYVAIVDAHEEAQGFDLTLTDGSRAWFKAGESLGGRSERGEACDVRAVLWPGLSHRNRSRRERKRQPNPIDITTRLLRAGQLRLRPRDVVEGGARRAARGGGAVGGGVRAERRAGRRHGAQGLVELE